MRQRRRWVPRLAHTPAGCSQIQGRFGLRQFLLRHTGGAFGDVEIAPGEELSCRQLTFTMDVRDGEREVGAREIARGGGLSAACDELAIVELGQELSGRHTITHAHAKAPDDAGDAGAHTDLCAGHGPDDAGRFDLGPHVPAGDTNSVCIDGRRRARMAGPGHARGDGHGQAAAAPRILLNMRCAPRTPQLRC